MATPVDVLAALRRRDSLNLFPTENRMSPAALVALASDAGQRYPSSEGSDFFYGDVAGLDDVYELCADLAREYFEARHAFVPFLSGLHTMHTVLTALCSRDDRVMVMDPSCGGHYATGPICQGYGFEVEHLPFDRATCMIDTARLGELAADRPPDLVYLDMSTALRLPRVREIRAAVPDARICLDASHIMGLLPAAPDTLALDALDSCSGSTHKTLPGPQKGLLVTNRDEIADLIRTRLPFAVSSGHSANVGALAITLAELLPNRVAYARQVMANAWALAVQLASRGFHMAGEGFGFTETHQVWIEPPLDVPHKEWGKRMAAANIRSTTVTLPSSGRPGLRLGVQELARSGMGSDEMGIVARLLARLLLDREAPEIIAAEVGAFVRDFPGVAFACSPADGAPVEVRS